MIRNIFLIGAGKLATCLGVALSGAGISIAGVYNRTPEKGKALAERLKTRFFSDIDSIPQADMFIIAVADQAIEEVAGKISKREGIFVHTSGTVDLSVFNDKMSYGVFYMPQSFTEKGPFDLKDVPVCIEGCDDETIDQLKEMAEKVSGRVVKMNSDQRLKLHLSAIISSNFSNFLYSVSQKIMNDAGLEMNMLLPIIVETAYHAEAEDIFKLQTGPAIREDLSVIEKHLDLLKEYPEYKSIYEILTNSIINHKHGNDKL